MTSFDLRWRAGAVEIKREQIKMLTTRSLYPILWLVKLFNDFSLFMALFEFEPFVNSIFPE